MPTLKRNSINNPKGIVLSFPTVVLRRPTDGDG
ncbi:MAG: diaminobutyrate acetyltransferase, partial [Gammaproteobacteria bacterium HGW-Gammaproteobacteria-6]